MRVGRLLPFLLAAAALPGCGGSSDTPANQGSAGGAKATRAGHDWTRFGYDAQRSNHAPRSLLRSVSGLKRRKVSLPGTVDSSPIYLHSVRVKGKRRDVFFVTTTYGRTLAIEAGTGKRLWQFVPKGIGSWEGSARITNTTPVADPDRRYVYAASSNGLIHKLSVASGREARGRWPVKVTKDSTHEKLASALNLSGRYVLAATGGYIGDAPPYQGHVLSISRSSGRIAGVFNSLCADRHQIIQPSTCKSSDSAIWARAGAVVMPKSKRILATTGNAPYDGKTDFGDTVLMLSPRARSVVQTYTPAEQKQLEDTDGDLGSSAPALLPESNPRVGVQGGKDSKLRVISLSTLNGRNRKPGSALGGQLQVLQQPDGQLFSAPAVAGSRMFVGSGGATVAYDLKGSRLSVAWSNSNPGTSPVIAGGGLLVFDPEGGGLRIYRPSDGKLLRTLPAGSGHWNSPAVGDGRIALPEGDANDHAKTGVLDIYSR
ncbi:MAG TPA: PQQ-binding-like beta-propeller repeat protein [Thermoleophilaceae bacterium]|jgi:outer membrane protein assembly factor BamB